MTAEQLKAVLAERENFRKFAQHYKGRTDELLGTLATPEELAKVADHLIATGLLDAGQKDAAIRVLAEPKKALDTVVNLASLVREGATPADGNPGRPIKTAQAAGGGGEPNKAYDWTDDPEYQAMTSDVIKLAAHAATV